MRDTWAPFFPKPCSRRGLGGRCLRGMNSYSPSCPQGGSGLPLFTRAQGGQKGGSVAPRPPDLAFLQDARGACEERENRTQESLSPFRLQPAVCMCVNPGVLGPVLGNVAYIVLMVTIVRVALLGGHIKT